MSLSLSDACLAIAPSVTLKINAMVAEMRANGQDVIALGAGEPDFDTPKHIRDAAQRAIEEGQTRYTAASGMPQLRQAVADFILQQKGLVYSKDEIIMGNGAKQVLLTALQAILNPGDEVLLPAPCWVSYPEMIAMAGGKPVWIYTTMEQGFVPTKEQLLSAITPRTKAIILNTPSNPTGAVWNRLQLEMLAQLAVEHQFYIISDEIYEKLVYDGAEHISIATLGEQVKNQTIMVNGFSKSYAMTGWRLGYGAGPRPVIAAMAAYQSHATGNPNSIAQCAGLAALQGGQQCVDEMVKAFDRRRKLMLGCIRSIPLISAFEPKGAFYVLLDVRAVMGREVEGKVLKDSLDFAQALLSGAQVAVVPGESFGAPGFCRLSYAVSDEKILEAMRRIADFTQRAFVTRCA